MIRPYHFRSRDVSRARADHRARFAAWSLLIGAGLMTGATFALFI